MTVYESPYYPPNSWFRMGETNLAAARAARLVHLATCEFLVTGKKKCRRETARRRGDEIVDAFTQGAQKRVADQLVPLFKPAHEQDLSAKPFANSLPILIGALRAGKRSKILREVVGTGNVTENQ
jgi:hypothetical protein